MILNTPSRSDWLYSVLNLVLIPQCNSPIISHNYCLSFAIMHLAFIVKFQAQFPQQMPYMPQQQQRQQQQQPSYPQPPTGMPRMPSSHPQPILPKPALTDMFGASSAGLRYPSNSDNLPGQDFASSRISDQSQHAVPSASSSYGNPPIGRMGSSSDMMAKYGSSQSAFQLGNPPPFPGPLHSRHTPSPNITLGSPLRSVADG